MKRYTIIVLPIVTALLTLGLYILTLAPTVIQIDTGELAAVQILLGIAHPTGYPFFTLAGHIFSLIPLPFRAIYQMNLLAALWCAASIGIFVVIIRYTAINLHLFGVEKFVRVKRKKKRGEDKKKIEIAEPVMLFKVISPLVAILSASLGGLVLGFSKTYWFQATSVEVYSAQIFLFMIIIGALLRAFIVTKSQPENTLKAWGIASIALALGFTNHMTTLMIIPAAIYLFFACHGFRKESFAVAGKLLLPFSAVLLLMYSYLPIGASRNPLINWGNPVDLERILRHISGKQYQVWLFSSFDAAKKQFAYFIENFPSEFNISIIFALLGLWFLLQRARKLFYFVGIAAVFTVLYSINYDINDIDAYFLLAYICIGFFAAFGIMYLFELLYDKKFHYGLALTAALVFAGVQVYYTVDKVDQHDTYTFEDYTHALLGSVQKDAVIISYQWDYFISPAYYLQHVENKRKDVSIIDKELLRRSWYYNQLERGNPGLLRGIAPDIQSFLTALKPFERSEVFDAQLLETYYQRIMSGLVTTNVGKRPVYIGVELYEGEMQRGEFTLPKGLTLVPDLFFFKVVKAGEYVPAPDPVFQIRFPKTGNKYTGMIKTMVSSMLVRRAMYEMEYSRVDRAKVYIRKIKSAFPDYQLPRGLAEVIVK
ncbi:MAG: DUF2723 domain-containing protein [Ignavibacteriales bacterium]|nr:DUF2723 domain-containing protein [Ignavibacteriales bacterium]